MEPVDIMHQWGVSSAIDVILIYSGSICGPLIRMHLVSSQ